MSSPLYIGPVFMSPAEIKPSLNSDCLRCAQPCWRLDEKILKISLDFLTTFQSLSQMWGSWKCSSWQALVPTTTWHQQQSKNNGSSFRECWGSLCLDYPLVQWLPWHSILAVGNCSFLASLVLYNSRNEAFIALKQTPSLASGSAWLTPNQVL